MKSQFSGLFILGALACSSVASAELVTNGDFETGDFTGWTLAADPNFTFVDTISGYFGNNDSLYVWAGETGQNGTLTQSIATTSGATYHVEFDFAGDGDSPSFFSAAFGGQTLLSTTDPDLDLDMVHYAYDVTATAASSDLVFTFRDDAFYVNFDNASVNAKAVPEPATMTALGLGVVAMIRRRRKA